MARKPFEIRMNGAAADLTITGEIGWWKNSAEEFTRQLAALQASGVTELRGYINSGGGDLFEGNEIYNLISAFPGRKTCVLGALVASSATVIACAFTDGIEMAANGQYMIHNPEVYVSGGEAELTASIQLYRNIRQSAIDIYAKRTGLAADEVGRMMDATTWMNAATALEKGFITGISGQSADLPDDLPAVLNKYNNVPAVLNQARQQPPADSPFSSSNPAAPSMKYAAIIARMGLPANSTDDQVEAAIAKMHTDKVAAETALTEERGKTAKAKAEMLVDAAIASKKVGAGEREQLVADATMNYDLVKRTLDRVPATTSATGTIVPEVTNATSTTPPTADGADRSKWTVKDFMDKDPEALKVMAEKEPTKYQALVTASYPATGKRN